MPPSAAAAHRTPPVCGPSRSTGSTVCAHAGVLVGSQHEVQHNTGVSCGRWCGPVQAVQRMLMGNDSPKAAVEWGHRQFESIRRDNARMLAG